MSKKPAAKKAAPKKRHTATAPKTSQPRSVAPGDTVTYSLTDEECELHDVPPGYKLQMTVETVSATGEVGLKGEISGKGQWRRGAYSGDKPGTFQ